MKLEGADFEELCKAIAGAFSPAELARISLEEMDLNLDHIVPPDGGHLARVSDVLRYLDAHERMHEFVIRARQYQPANRELQRIYARLVQKGILPNEPEERNGMYHSLKYPGLAGTDRPGLLRAESLIEFARREQRSELGLSGLHLTSVPEELWELYHLQILHLDNNDLNSLPESLGRLFQLRILHLNNNRIALLPDSLSQLHQLQELYLDENRFYSLPDALGYLTQLRILGLSSNDLVILPETLGRLSELRQLDLSGNNLTTLPETLGQLSELLQLDLSGNHLTTLPREVVQLSQLEDLRLHSNKFVVLPETLGQLSHLRKLDLSNNELRTLPESLGLHSQLLELNLSLNDLISLPPTLGQLSQLRLLYLENNWLTSLPETLGQLSHLEELNLASNELESLPDTLGQLSRLKELYLYENELTSLPAALGQLSKLERLHVSNNQLKSLPETLGHLTSLRTLLLFQNNLTSVPDSLGELRWLQYLDLSNNWLASLPESVGRLSRLQHFDLHGNQLTSLPESLHSLANKGKLRTLFLHGSDVLGLPSEVLGPTWDAVQNHRATPAKPLDILEYYFATRGGVARALRELKVILVGRGEVGKTTLAETLQGKRFERNRPKTEGIAITPWKVDLRDGVADGIATAHLWDFGGQQIMHGTHQFFMTHRAIYLVVLDGRDDRTKQESEYWLKMVRAFGGEASPVLLVLNKQGEHPYSIDSEYFVKKYGIAPEHIFRTECADPKDAGVSHLREAILAEAAKLLAKREVFPGEWWEMKTYLAGMRERGEDFLSDDQYHTLCEKMQVPEEQRDGLLRILSELGVVVSFPDEVALAHLLVLNPEWATDGVYRVLNDRDLLERKRGHLSLADLKRILPAQRWAKPRHRQYILDLMAKFELCFPVEGKTETVLVPELLPDKTPALDDWKAEECLVFLYRYPALPQGVLPRFITRTHELSEGHYRWRSGVILEREGAQALVRADYDRNVMTIMVRGNLGPRRRQLLCTVRDHLESIHARIKSLGEEALLTLPSHPDVTVLLDDVLEDEEHHKRTIRLTVEGRRSEVQIKTLLEGVDTKKDKKRRSLKDASPSPTYPRNVFVQHLSIRDQARLSMDNIEEQIVANTVQKIDGGTFHGPVGVNQDLANYYAAAEKLEAPGRRELAQALVRAVQDVLPKLDEPSKADVMESLHTLMREIAREEPRKQWLTVSAEGLLEAASTTSPVAPSIFAAVTKVMELFRH